MMGCLNSEEMAIKQSHSNDSVWKLLITARFIYRGETHDHGQNYQKESGWPMVLVGKQVNADLTDRTHAD